MKKRLRKKLHLKEFQEMGFEINFEIDKDLGAEKIDALTEAFILEAIEGNGLFFGGGGNHLFHGFVCRKNGSATQEDRTALENWLQNQGASIKQYTLGELKDAWYP